MFHSFREWLAHEIQHYEQLQARLAACSMPDPGVFIEVRHSKGYVQYYAVKRDAETKAKERTYLKQEELKKARPIVQLQYQAKALKVVEKSLRQLKAMQRYNENALQELYQKMSVERRALVVPVEKLPEQRMAEWYRKPGPQWKRRFNATTFCTNNGECVRSKSEKILADLFERMKIPYIYEKPLVLGTVALHPDFTFYNPETDEEIYWEHMGRMDDPDYVDSALRKLKLYIDHEIYVGERLIITMESSRRPLNQDMVLALIQRHLDFALPQ